MKRARGLLLIAGMCIALNVRAQEIDFDVPATDAVHAIPEFARQAGLQIVAPADGLKRINTVAVKGRLDPRVALKQLLVGTGLEVASDDGAVITLRRVTGPSGVYSTHADETSGSTAGIPAASAPEVAKLDEVVVTAEKREERALDVPVPLTAISADSLVARNQLRIQDYYTRVPGLSFSTGIRGEPFISIRGITTTGYSNPTVGITVDDTPYGSSTFLGGGYSAPDIDPSELVRVEVLRGPQGTLYGASSIGGLLKYVTVDPSTDSVSGRIQGGLNGVHNGDEPGYSLRGAVNVPLSDHWAVRFSGFTRRDPGYIDDPGRGIQGVNWGTADGGRLSTLWQPSSLFSLKFGALYQVSKTHGSSFAFRQPGFGDLQQSALRNTGTYDKKLQAYSLTLAAKLGNSNLISVTGYGVNRVSAYNDFSSLYGDLSAALFGVNGASLLDENRTGKFTQEVRLSAPIGHQFEWLIGAFYTNEDTQYRQDILAADPATGAPVGVMFGSDFPTTFREYAAFANLTINATERFDIQLGARSSHNRQSYSQVDMGPLVGGQVESPKVNTNESSFTYLVTPRFKIAPDIMVYGRLASGYRPGGPNAGGTMFGLPLAYNADKTRNYEIGIKGGIPNYAFTFDASLYYIDWQDIQLTLTVPTSGQSYNSNGSRAKSQGIELAVVSKPLSGLAITAWATWNEALLTRSFPIDSAAYGVRGDRLPMSSRVSSNLSLDQEFPITGSVIGTIGGSVTYVGNRKGDFTSSSQRQDFPSYVQADFRAGVSFNSWTANFFVSNVADNRGVLAGGLGTPFPFAFAYIQPRTVGLNIARTF